MEMHTSPIVAANEWDANHGLRGLKGVTQSRDASPHMTTEHYVEYMDLNNTIWVRRSSLVLSSPRRVLTGANEPHAGVKRLDFSRRYILEEEAAVPVSNGRMGVLL